MASTMAGMSSSEWRSGVLHELACEQAVNLFDVALVQGFKEGGPVREVLVERSDTDPCDLGDPVGGDRLEALALQEPYYSIQDRLDGLASRRCCGRRRTGDFALLDGMRTSLEQM